MTSGSENNPDLSFNINTCTGMPTYDIFYSCVNPDYTHTQDGDRIRYTQPVA